MIKNEAALQFSGGIDSLLSSVTILKDFNRVHLLTFDKGYLEFGIENNLLNVTKLKELFGEDKFIHKIINIKNIFKPITVKSINKDIRQS
jgi:7-cyano-7-deazaguanine synthase in queuosine biosynthesis